MRNFLVLLPFLTTFFGHRKSKWATKKVDLLELQEGKNASSTTTAAILFSIRLGDSFWNFFYLFFENFSHCDAEEHMVK